MRLTRSPVELIKARTMPMWPLWALVILTPPLHIWWATVLSGLLEEELSGSGDEVVITVDLASLTPEILSVAIALGVWVWHHFFRRDVDRSPVAADLGWLYRRGSMTVHPGRFRAFPRPRKKGAAITRVAWGMAGDNFMSSYTLWTSRVHRYSIERVELPTDLDAQSS